MSLPVLRFRTFSLPLGVPGKFPTKGFKILNIVKKNESISQIKE